MAHRVALYTVQVRRKRDTTGNFRLLGDIDEQGTRLADVLVNSMENSFEVLNGEKTRSVRCDQVSVEGNEIFAEFMHGQTGIAADIVDKAGDLLLRQSPADTSRVRCGVLLHLPPAQNMGWLAAHNNNGRAVKGLIDKGIQERFRQAFPHLLVEINPFVLGSALATAIEENRIERVKLRKLDQSTDRAGAGKWVQDGTIAKLELSITPTGRTKRILSTLPRRFIRGDNSAFGEIVQFDGIEFDEARFEVSLPDGSTRTYNITRPEEGHPFTEDIGNELQMRDGEPTSESLRRALRRSLSDVRG